MLPLQEITAGATTHQTPNGCWRLPQNGCTCVRADPQLHMSKQILDCFSNLFELTIASAIASVAAPSSAARGPFAAGFPRRGARSQPGPLSRVVSIICLVVPAFAEPGARRTPKIYNADARSSVIVAPIASRPWRWGRGCNLFSFLLLLGHGLAGTLLASTERSGQFFVLRVTERERKL